MRSAAQSSGMRVSSIAPPAVFVHSRHSAELISGSWFIPVLPRYAAHEYAMQCIGMRVTNALNLA